MLASIVDWARRAYAWTRPLRSSTPPPRGSAEWLTATEKRFGGMVTGVARNRVSPVDPRTPQQIATGGMVGGDRMEHHGYAEHYARHLRPFLDRGAPLTIAEFGILRGTGLALWCELFPEARVMGFDVDLGHIQGNRANLDALGAFAHNEPELHEYDQLVDDSERVAACLAGGTIDIAVDDGLHHIDSIARTLASVRPHLSERFVYFVEDNDQVAPLIAERHPDLQVESIGEFTVLTPRRAPSGT